MNADFYLYEHTRRDTGAVFYVGKGKGARARSTQGRNLYWQRIAAKGYDVAIVARGLPEELAHFAECERIAQLRALGVRLANLTDGGDGMAGHVQTAETRAKRRASMTGVTKSAEHRAALSAACIGRVLSEATRAKIGEKARGKPSSMLGKKHSEEAKARISAAQTGERNHFYGKTQSADSVARTRAANIGRRDSAETREKKSAARQGRLNPAFGRTIPEEQKQRQIAALRARPLVTCPHCNRTLDESNAKRWHFNNCRSK